jgi:hypothetical protein
MTEKMLLEEPEAQSHNSDMGENAYVPSEHSDQEECDNVSTPETDSDRDNMTASDDNDADHETEGGGGGL